jgi:hypothetical protein
VREYTLTNIYTKYTNSLQLINHVKQDRVVVEHTRGADLTTLPDHKSHPSASEVVESVVVVSESPVVNRDQRT